MATRMNAKKLVLLLFCLMNFFLGHMFLSLGLVLYNSHILEQRNIGIPQESDDHSWQVSLLIGTAFMLAGLVSVITGLWQSWRKRRVSEPLVPGTPVWGILTAAAGLGFGLAFVGDSIALLRIQSTAGGLFWLPSSLTGIVLMTLGGGGIFLAAQSWRRRGAVEPPLLAPGPFSNWRIATRRKPVQGKIRGDVWFCPSCGNLDIKGSEFCPRCGRLLPPYLEFDYH